MLMITMFGVSVILYANFPNKTYGCCTFWSTVLIIFYIYLRQRCSKKKSLKPKIWWEEDIDFIYVLRRYILYFIYVRTEDSWNRMCMMVLVDWFIEKKYIISTY